MRILISDRDERTARLVGAKVEGMGHTVRYEPDRRALGDLLTKSAYDLVIADPSPMTDVGGVIVSIRKAARQNTLYIMMMSDSLEAKTVLSKGANDLLAKPISPQELEQKVQSAERFNKIVDWVGDSSEDFPSAGGIIAKSAFNQLFLSAIDRSARYGEKSYVLFISIDNHEDILAMDGQYSAKSSSAKLAQHLVKIRRQSDILAQIGKSDYALLLQRPVYETEPMEAANRFADSISKIEEMEETGAKELCFSVRLMDVPSGTEHVVHKFKIDLLKK